MTRIRDMNGPIEPNIEPLCAALNGVPGVSTRASCQGHVFPASPPYVMFDAPVAFAAALEKQLREDAYSRAPRLQTLWIVEGMFDGEYELCFHLVAPEYREHGRFCLKFSEKRLGKDFDIISSIIYKISI